MEIKFHNDGKEKDQSHSASAELFQHRYEGAFHISINGWGSTKEEAKANLREELINAQKAIADALAEIGE